MFKAESTTTFNNILFNGHKIAAMHDSMQRLYDYVATRGITQPSELARALNQSQQTITNWENRGISQKGFIACQATFGVNAVWLETGKGTPTPTAPAAAPALPPDEQALLDLYRGLTDDQRGELVRSAQATKQMNEAIYARLSAQKKKA